MSSPRQRNQVRYVVITPARNEAQHIENTIASMVRQSLTPRQWVIVNDGSEDGTADIVQRHIQRVPWMTLVQRPNRGFREPGVGVVQAFYEGYGSIHPHDWEFLVKLDADLSFASDYFQRCFEAFETNPRLGICGGTVCHQQNGTLLPERCPAFHVRGATKIYRRKCWDDIGGLPRITGWDTVDEVKANMLGWQTASLPHVKIVHHRYTGSADGSWQNAVKNGRANYIAGYHPLFMLAKCLKRLPERPFVIGAIGLLCGFISGYLRRIPQLDDREVIRYLRQQQIQRLLLRETIWK